MQIIYVFVYDSKLSYFIVHCCIILMYVLVGYLELELSYSESASGLGRWDYDLHTSSVTGIVGFRGLRQL